LAAAAATKKITAKTMLPAITAAINSVDGMAAIAAFCSSAIEITFFAFSFHF
jgi:hypothetical protein